MSESVTHRVERQLRADILALIIAPGARISEQEIGERYGCSRQPAREALISLSRSRLVEILPQRGAVVARISMAKLMQAAFVRETLETAVVRAACNSFHFHARARLDDCLNAQRRAAEEGNDLEFRRYDNQFHATIAEGAGLAMAWSTIEDLKAHIDRACCLSLHQPSALAELVTDHTAIVDALDQRDPEKAAAAMALHLGQLLKGLPELEARHPDFFE